MLTETENAILQQLVELDAAVKSIATAAAKPDLLSIFSGIDELTNRLPSDTDPELIHFLRKKSYEKARFWLEGRKTEITRGSCRRD